MGLMEEDGGGSTGQSWVGAQFMMGRVGLRSWVQMLEPRSRHFVRVLKLLEYIELKKLELYF